MGSRRLRHWLHHPLRDTGPLRERQAAIEALVHPSSRLRHPRLAELFASWADVERITARVALRSARPRDLRACATRSRRSPSCTRRSRARARRARRVRAALAPDEVLHDRLAAR
jgi:DNA mismatch repair protein MutS